MRKPSTCRRATPSTKRLAHTLETAAQFGFTGQPFEAYPANTDDLDALLDEWMKLSVALNSLNRSMGAPDVYPFAISPRVSEKLGFIHRLIAKRPRTVAA